MANARRNLLDSIMADMNNARTSTSCSTRSATARDHAEACEPPKKKARKATSSGEPDEDRAVSEAANNSLSDMDVLKSQMSALTKMVKESIAPTVRDMKRDYDAAAAHANMAADNDASDSEESECEASEEGEVIDEPDKAKSTGIDKLFDEVNKNIPTSAAINQKMADIVNKIASEGLDSDMKKSRVDKYAKPANTPLLQAPRVNAEIWENAGSNKTVTDTYIRRCLEMLCTGITPIVQLAHATSDAINEGRALPPPKEFWEKLTDSAILLTTTLHDVNMIRRDLFKPGLDGKYKSLCSDKHPITEELFGDNLADRLRNMEESKKSASKLGGSRYANNNIFANRGAFLGENRAYGRGYRRPSYGHQYRDRRDFGGQPRFPPKGRGAPRPKVHKKH